MKTKTRAFHERMQEARRARGYTLDDAVFHFRQIAPAPWRCSRAKISRLESAAADEAKVDPVLIWLLAQVYDTDLEELSPVAAAGVGAIIPLMEATQRRRRSNCSVTSAGQSVATLAA